MHPYLSCHPVGGDAWKYSIPLLVSLVGGFLFMNKLIMIVAVTLMLWLLLNTTNVAQPVGNGGGDCVGAYAAQYRPQWAEMSKVERAIVGLRMSACEGYR